MTQFVENARLLQIDIKNLLELDFVTEGKILQQKNNHCL